MGYLLLNSTLIRRLISLFSSQLFLESCAFSIKMLALGMVKRQIESSSLNCYFFPFTVAIPQDGKKRVLFKLYV